MNRGAPMVAPSLRHAGRSLLLGAFVAIALFSLSLLFVRPAPRRLPRVQPLFIDADGAVGGAAIDDGAAVALTLPAVNVTTAVNPHPFGFLLNEEDFCKRRPDLFVLAIVHTSLGNGNYKRRMLIRETWASQQLYGRVKTVVLFAMGSANDERLMNSVKLECERYRDIIQEDFLDSYLNLTYKSVMLLKWVSLYCPEAPFVLKVDDDVFVNIFNLVSYLHNLHQHNLANKRSILCLLWTSKRVSRDNASKWYVKPEDYPNEYYSPYCSGLAYVLSSDLIYPLYRASFTTKFFWLEDFYVTGLLPLGLGVNYTNMASLYVLKAEKLRERLVDGYALFGHVPGATTMDRRALLWRQLLHNRRLMTDTL